MSPQIVELFKQASAMDESDRATLAGLLLESLDQTVDADAEFAWNHEIKRRLDEMAAGTVQLEDWDDVKKDFLKDTDAGTQS